MKFSPLLHDVEFDFRDARSDHAQCLRCGMGHVHHPSVRSRAHCGAQREHEMWNVPAEIRIILAALVATLSWLLVVFISIIISFFLLVFFFGSFDHNSSFWIWLVVYLSLQCALYFAKRQNRNEFVGVIDEIRGVNEEAIWDRENRELQSTIQLAGDEIAQSLVNKISSNSQFAPYSLFLRAFAADGRWELKIDKRMIIKGEHPLLVGAFGGGMTIDSFLAQITQPFVPLVALSVRQSKSLSRPRFAKVSGEEWQGAVLTLIDHSSCIFCLPGRQNGIVWENQRIVERADRLHKTIFVQPPSRAKRAFVSFHASRARKDWAKTKTFFKEKCGLPMPDLNDDGAFFVVSRAGERFDYRILCRVREMVGARTLEDLILHVSDVAAISPSDFPKVQTVEDLFPESSDG